MNDSLKEQIKKLQSQGRLPEYVRRKRDFPYVTNEQIERKAVIYVPLSEEEGLIVKGKYSNKDKWIVVIGTCENGDIIGALLINTDPNNFSPDLGAMQFPLLKKDYPFLDYKSWLDCSEIFRIPRTKLLKYGGYCGTIAEDDWRFIWDALVQTRFISEEDKMELGILSSND